MDRINLKKVSISEIGLDENSIQEMIADNPSIIGLGNLQLLGRERIQSGAGRLDILLKDIDSDKRYEVEIQLKQTDPHHIIRTLEYWDVERKRFPQYEHCAVIIAEDITNRFFNVISLFNGFIPIIAIQMNAYKIEDSDKYGIVFTKILNQSSLIAKEESEKQEPVDRSYWETRGETLEIAHFILSLINSDQNSYSLNYTKSYIGIKNKGQKNIIVFFNRQNGAIVSIRLSQTDDVDTIINDANIETMSYDWNWNSYRLKIYKSDLSDEKKVAAIKNLVSMAESEYCEQK